LNPSPPNLVPQKPRLASDEEDSDDDEDDDDDNTKYQDVEELERFA
jgi:hypothetical protein